MTSPELLPNDGVSALFYRNVFPCLSKYVPELKMSWFEANSARPKHVEWCASKRKKNMFFFQLSEPPLGWLLMSFRVILSEWVIGCEQLMCFKYQGQWTRLCSGLLGTESSKHSASYRWSCACWTGINTDSQHQGFMKEVFLPLRFTGAFKVGLVTR